MTRGWGGLVDLMPAGEGLGHRQWARLGVVVVLEDLGRAEDAGVLVCGIRADLEREAGRRTAAESARSARQARMAVRPVLPEAERGHSEAALKRFDKIRRKLALRTLNEKQRDLAAVELAQIERGPSETEDEESLKRHLQTIEHLELLRHPETPSEHDAVGRLKIMARDPLAAMLTDGLLTLIEHMALAKYRDLFEERREILGSQLGASNPGSGAIDVEREQRQQARADKVRLLLLAADTAVKTRAGRNGRGLMVLREVAGKGHSITAIGGGGATRHRNKCAFILAAQVLADHWGLT